ncbi:MAG: WD40 domain protein beta Propeller [Parcubacteria group bacterium GW2011_GWC2_38_7]|nr:MAG: WD40 domain protein beta Propeller [Parcubacteria group bacterium GW2011_GWC2_38_7]
MRNPDRKCHGAVQRLRQLRVASRLEQPHRRTPCPRQPTVTPKWPRTCPRVSSATTTPPDVQSCAYWSSRTATAGPKATSARSATAGTRPSATSTRWPCRSAKSTSTRTVATSATRRSASSTTASATRPTRNNDARLLHRVGGRSIYRRIILSHSPLRIFLNIFRSH